MSRIVLTFQAVDDLQKLHAYLEAQFGRGSGSKYIRQDLKTIVDYVSSGRHHQPYKHLPYRDVFEHEAKGYQRFYYRLDDDRTIVLLHTSRASRLTEAQVTGAIQRGMALGLDRRDPNDLLNSLDGIATYQPVR